MPSSLSHTALPCHPTGYRALPTILWCNLNASYACGDKKREPARERRPHGMQNPHRVRTVDIFRRSIISPICALRDDKSCEDDGFLAALALSPPALTFREMRCTMRLTN